MGIVERGDVRGSSSGGGSTRVHAHGRRAVVGRGIDVETWILLLPFRSSILKPDRDDESQRQRTREREKTVFTRSSLVFRLATRRERD